MARWSYVWTILVIFLCIWIASSEKNLGESLKRLVRRQKRFSQPRPPTPDFQTLWHRLKKMEGELLKAYLVYLGKSKDCPLSERLWRSDDDRQQSQEAPPRLIVDQTGPPFDHGFDPSRRHTHPPGPYLDPYAPQIQPTAPPHRWQTIDPYGVQIQPTAPPHLWNTLDPNAVQIQPTAPPHRWNVPDPNAPHIQPTAPPHRWQTLDPNAPQIQPPGPPSTCQAIPGLPGIPGQRGIPGLPGPPGLSRRDVEEIIRKRAPDLCLRYC